MLYRWRRDRKSAAAAPRIRRDDAADKEWVEIYSELSEGQPGLFGAVTARGEALTMRLATLYAVLDCSEVVTLDHLFAAHAVWLYSEESARYIFGDRLGDPLADRILELLRQSEDGLTRTEVSNKLGGHTPSDKISRALSDLAELGLADSQYENSRGRRLQRWFVPSS